MKWTTPAAVVVIGAMTMMLAGGAEAPAGAQGTRPRPRHTGSLVIDHRSVADFDRLPDEAIRAAAGLRFLLRSASIGWNMDQGLNCLANAFPDRPRRPYACDKGVPPSEVVYGAKYARPNWSIEIRGNPGWWGKVSDFVTRVNGIVAPGSFDVVGFNFNYADGLPGSNIVNKFFATVPDTHFGNVGTLEALEKAHPDMVFAWWSMALPRMSSPEMQQFNRTLRAYATTHGKVFIDLGDLESHRPDGSTCTDNQGAGLEAICAEYTDERNGGHLNALGSLRAAKAIWVLMAKLAGWGG